MLKVNRRRQREGWSGLCFLAGAEIFVSHESCCFLGLWTRTTGLTISPNIPRPQRNHQLLRTPAHRVKESSLSTIQWVRLSCWLPCYRFLISSRERRVDISTRPWFLFFSHFFDSVLTNSLFLLEFACFLLHLAESPPEGRRRKYHRLSECHTLLKKWVAFSAWRRGFL